MMKISLKLICPCPGGGGGAYCGRIPIRSTIYRRCRRTKCCIARKFFRGQPPRHDSTPQRSGGGQRAVAQYRATLGGTFTPSKRLSLIWCQLQPLDTILRLCYKSLGGIDESGRVRYHFRRAREVTLRFLLQISMLFAKNAAESA